MSYFPPAAKSHAKCGALSAAGGVIPTVDSGSPVFNRAISPFRYSVFNRALFPLHLCPVFNGALFPLPLSRVQPRDISPFRCPVSIRAIPPPFPHRRKELALLEIAAAVDGQGARLAVPFGARINREQTRAHGGAAGGATSTATAALGAWKERSPALCDERGETYSGRLATLLENGVDPLRPREVFDQFDEDGGGSINAAELGAALKKLGKEASPDELAEMVREADTDGNGAIEFEEFAGMVDRLSAEVSDSAFGGKWGKMFSLGEFRGATAADDDDDDDEPTPPRKEDPNSSDEDPDDETERKAKPEVVRAVVGCDGADGADGAVVAGGMRKRDRLRHAADKVAATAIAQGEAATRKVGPLAGKMAAMEFAKGEATLPARPSADKKGAGASISSPDFNVYQK